MLKHLRRPLKRRIKPRRKPARHGSLARRLFGYLQILALVVIVPLGVGLGAGGFMAFARTVPSILELKQDVAPPATRIFAEDDSLIGELKVMKGKHVPLNEMPQDLLSAVIAVEDAHFWTHKGIDYMAIFRAAVADVMEGSLKEGASTITMQLAKNTFLTPEKKFTRKIKEAVLAIRIERNLSKEEILEIYLNRAYFGHGAYGVEMAARAYFDKPVGELTLPEAALVAGLLKAPSRYSPFADFKRAKNRQETVLKRMEDEEVITRKQRVNALKSPIFLNAKGTDSLTNNYFIDYVKDYLENKYGHDQVYKGGLRVYTTLNREAQDIAQAAVQQGLRDLDKRRGFRGPIEHVDLSAPESEAHGLILKTLPPRVGDIKRGTVVEVKPEAARVRVGTTVGTLAIKDAVWAESYLDMKTLEHASIKDFSLKKILSPGDVIMARIVSLDGESMGLALDQEPEAQGALVAIEPFSGYIRALVGGHDFNLSQYNRALYAKRQVGSAFKPIIYALALTRGFTPASIIVDEEVSYRNSEDPDDIYSPRNYDNLYHGPTRLRVALTKSRNVVTVKLVDALGINRVTSFAQDLGITSELPRNLTVALGSMSITPLEMTSAYSAFANKGVRMKPLGIKYITDRSERVIENNVPSGAKVMSEENAYLITSMLESVVREGTGWRAKALRRPVAGKTGTTNDYYDAWFLGFTPDLVTGVWVGFDEPRFLGPAETGSKSAAPIWVEFMKKVLAGTLAGDFTRPDGVVAVRIDPETGLLAGQWTANAIEEYFVEGTEPKEITHSIWQTGEQDDLFGGSGGSPLSDGGQGNQGDEQGSLFDEESVEQ